MLVLAGALPLAAAAAPLPFPPPIDTLALEMAPRDAAVLFNKDELDTSTFAVTVLPGDGPALRGRIEVKGSFTRRLKKKSLLIKLDPGSQWRGQSRISLNAMGTDPTQMREWLSWSLIHALGMAAPQVRYTRLTLNGRDSGLFLWIEWIEPQLFERHGLGADGEFYHPDDAAFCGDLSRRSLRPELACWFKLAPRDGDMALLRDWVQDIRATPVDQFHRLVERTVERDSLVNWIVVNGIASNTDSYNKNYFLYRSAASQRWTVVPWDFDLTFGRSFDPFADYPANRLNDNFQYFYPLALGQPNPLRDKALKNEPLRQRIHARVAELLQGAPTAAQPWRGWFAPARLRERVAMLDALLQPERARDPFLAGAGQRIEDERDALHHYLAARARYLQRVVLDGSDWVRDSGVAVLPAARGEVAVTDGWGYTLAELAVHDPGSASEVEVRVRRGRPSIAPPGIHRSSCVQRSWTLVPSGRGRVPLQAEITLEYLQENRANDELGGRVDDERALRVYRRSGRDWEMLPTRVQPLANTLSLGALRMVPGEEQWFVACQPPILAQP